MLRQAIAFARAVRAHAGLPPALRAAARRDRWEGLGDDPGINWAVEAGLEWLGRAQDESATADGGVARHYGLRDGWAPSYPETTGYIIPTLLEQAELRRDEA